MAKEDQEEEVEHTHDTESVTQRACEPPQILAMSISQR